MVTKKNKMLDKDNIKKGDTFHLIINGRKRKAHVEHVFDSVSGEKMLLYRWYGIYKQWWHYQVETLSMIIVRSLICEQKK